jgi:hypothetical protein
MWKHLCIGRMVFIMLVCAVQFPAGPATAGSQELSMIHEANGFATITGNTTREMARKLAVDAARIQVVRPLGVQVDNQTISSMGLKIADWYRIKASGYIVHDEVIEESLRDGGIWVRIRAWIKSGPAAEDIDRQMLNHHRILFVSQDKESGLIESDMITKLAQVGYKCLDSGFVKNNIRPGTWDQLVNRQLYGLNQEAFKFMADLVIHISSLVELGETSAGMNWYDGQSQVSLYQLSGDDRGIHKINSMTSSDKLVTRAGDSRKMMRFLLSPGNNHPNSFRKKIAEPVTADFLTKLSTCKELGTNSVSIELTVTNIPSAAEYVKLKNRINVQAGVVSGSLRELGQDNQTYQLGVRYRLKSIYLANLIAAEQKYKVTGHSWNSIKLAYNTER